MGSGLLGDYILLGNSVGYLMNLKFGFTNIPYRESFLYSPKPVRIWRARAAVRGYGRGKTTSQVADELERKYHIVETFRQARSKEINQIVEKAASRAIRRAPFKKTPEITYTQKDCKAIQDMFRTFLLQREMDGRVPGVPTQRSLRGVSHKEINPFARRASRPSFIDTGTYMDAFRVTSE